jgi:hypothetical protein
MDGVTVRVVFDHQRKYRLRLAWRVVVAVLGGLLLVAGIVAAAVPFADLAVRVYLILSGDTVPPISATERDVLVVASAVALGGLAVGLSLVRGRRRVLLFLRRFRDTKAAGVVVSAAKGSLGRTWRLVTLTGGDADGTGQGRAARRLATGAVVAGLAAVAAVPMWMFRRGLHDFALRAAHDVVKPSGSWHEWVGAVVFGSLVVLVVMALVGTAVVLVLASASHAVRPADRAKAGYVWTYHQIGPVTRMIERRSRTVVAPRFAVLVVADLVWQQTVARLATLSPAVLVDVSRPSERLWWEIETLAQERPARWVLVGHHPELGWLTGGPPASGGRDRAERRLRQLLDGEEVLAYTTDPHGRRRFARALRAKLTTISRQRARDSGLIPPVPVAAAMTALLAVVVATAVVR